LKTLTYAHTDTRRNMFTHTRIPSNRRNCLQQTHTHKYTDTFSHTHMHLAKQAQGRLSTGLGENAYLCMLAYTHIYVYVYIYAYIHIYIFTPGKAGTTAFNLSSSRAARSDLCLFCIYMWYDRFTCLTCALTCVIAGEECTVAYVNIVCDMTQLVHMRDMTHLYVRHVWFDSFTQIY